MQQKEFEQYLRENLLNGIVDFSLRAHETAAGSIEFYVHPARHGGETPDYRVFGNRLTQVNYDVNTREA